MSSHRALPPLKSLQAFRYAAQTLSFKKAAESLVGIAFGALSGAGAGD